MAGEVEAKLRVLLADVLALPPAEVARFDARTPLFGARPELDSMAAAALLGELEERFAIRIEDDEVSGDLFRTFGSLLDFTEAKVAG